MKNREGKNKIKRKVSLTSKKLIALSRKHGKRDGKNQVPRKDWGQNSVPYLMQLQRKYAVMSRELDLEFDQKKLRRESQKIAAMKREIQEKSRSSALEKNLSRAEADFARLNLQLEGGSEEGPMSKFARVRVIGNSFYFIFLTLLFIGEFFITAPAFKFLLGEHTATAYIVTLSASGLSVGVAHILGIVCKTKFDSTRPKPVVFDYLFATLAIYVVVLIVFLSNIRARNSLLTSGNLTGLSDTSKLNYLWAFFSVLQLTFVLVGIAVSFLHYSEIQSSFQKARRKVWLLHRTQTRRDAAKFASGASLERQVIDIAQLLNCELEILESEKILLRSQYEVAVAAYRDANINSRSDEMDGSHPALQPIDLNFQNVDFEVNPISQVGAK